MMDQRAPGFRELKKFRQCFIFQNQYFIVETIINVDHQPTFLRVETSKDSREIHIPDFVRVLKEVTTEDIYASGSIAKIGWKMPDEDKKEINIRLKIPVPVKKYTETARDTKKGSEPRKLSPTD